MGPNTSLPRVAVRPLRGATADARPATPEEAAAWNTGVYAGELVRFGFTVEIREYHARGLTQGLLWVGRPGGQPAMIRVELDPETQSLRGVWDNCTVILTGGQINALTGMVRRNLRRLREHSGRRAPETVADQEAFLVRLMETLVEAGANRRHVETEPPGLYAVPDHEETT